MDKNIFARSNEVDNRENNINSADSANTAANRTFTVSLIIPTLNEVDNLPLVFSYIPFEWVDEVILVDGRSQDDTVDMARSLLPDIKVVFEKQPGKGAALQAGYRAAMGDILIVMDADGSNDPREIPRFIQALIQGADFVKGSRFAPQGGTTDMERLRQIGNWGFVKLTNLLFATQFTDLLYGYHAFWRYCLDLIDLSGVDGFEIDTYLYINAVRSKLRVVDVPSFEGYRFHGDGKLKTFPDGWRVLKTIFKEWGNSLRSNPEDRYKGFRSILPPHRDPSSLRMKLRERRLEQQAKILMKSGGRMLQNVLQLLQHSVEQLPEDGSYQGIMQDLMVLAVKSMGASGGSLMILDDEGRLRSSYNVQNGHLRPMNVQNAESTMTYGLAGWIRENQHAAIVDNTLEDNRWLSRDWEVRKGVPRSALGLPLVNHDRVRAVLVLTREDGPFSEADLGLEDTQEESAAVTNIDLIRGDI